MSARPAPSSNYHDYVIRDGVFIGAFDEMYRNCADPWGQDVELRAAERVALDLLAEGRYRSVLDLGCGKGRFSRELQAATGAAVTALDLSPTAVAVARQRYPTIEFVATGVPPLAFRDETFDLVVTAELLWYVLPDLSRLFGEIARVMRPGGHYLLFQHFYRPGEQRYGRDVLQTPEDLLARLPFTARRRVDVDRATNHKLILLLEKP